MKGQSMESEQICEAEDCWGRKAVKKIMGKWYCKWHADKLEALSIGDIYS
jgi:hypothetical protein